MNRILKSALLFISAVCFLVSCKTKVEPQDSYLPVTYINLEGTWKLDSYMGNALPENSYVYIKLQRSDSKFTIYDNQASGLVRVKTGTFFVDESASLIDGMYDYSNEHWTSSYAISELSSDRMVWTASGDPEDVSVYVRSELPEDLQDR